MSLHKLTKKKGDQYANGKNEKQVTEDHPFKGTRVQEKQNGTKKN